MWFTRKYFVVKRSALPMCNSAFVVPEDCVTSRNVVLRDAKQAFRDSVMPVGHSMVVLAQGAQGPWRDWRSELLSGFKFRFFRLIFQAVCEFRALLEREHRNSNISVHVRRYKIEETNLVMIEDAFWNLKVLTFEWITSSAWTLCSNSWIVKSSAWC
jgi:hypothetical protein